MGNFIETTLLWIASHPTLKFGTIGIATALQGESGVLIGALLMRRGEIRLWELLVVAVSAILVYESLVYVLGRAIRRTALGSFIEKRIKNHERIEKGLHENAPKTLALSRLIIYLSLAVVFLSGWMKVKYFTFIRYRLVGIITWLGIVTPLFLFLTYKMGVEREEWVIREIFSATLIILIFLIGMKRIVAEWMGLGGKGRKRKEYR